MNELEELEMLRVYIQRYAHPLGYAEFKRQWISDHPEPVIPLTEVEETETHTQQMYAVVNPTEVTVEPEYEQPTRRRRTRKAQVEDAPVE